MNVLLPDKKWDAKAIDRLLEMSNGGNAETLYNIGLKVADNIISENHFSEDFLLK